MILNSSSIVLIHGLQGHPFKTWAAEACSRGHQKDENGHSHKGKAISDDSWLRKLQGLFVRESSSKSTQSCFIDEGDEHVFWPRDLLPGSCPRARISVFGYQTDIAKHQFAGAVNKNSIFAHSKNLVNELARQRPLRRPILFVTHSLGGVVIKEVFVPLRSFGAGNSAN
jgi:protein SERAC1